MPDVTHIAVITSNYNHAPYLKEYVDSVLAAKRTAEDFVGPLRIDFFIGDNASTDASKAVLINLAREHKAMDVNFFVDLNHRKRTQNSIYNSFIMGAEKQKIQYAVMLDADDCLTPNYFKLTIPQLHVESSLDHTVGYVYTDLDFVNNKGRLIRRGLCEGFSRAATEVGGYSIPTPALMTMECLASGLRYDESLTNRINQSRYEKLHTQRGWTGAHIPEVGFKYRVHGQNISKLGQLVYRTEGVDGSTRGPVLLRNIWANDVGGVS